MTAVTIDRMLELISEFNTAAQEYGEDPRAFGRGVAVKKAHNALVAAIDGLLADHDRLDWLDGVLTGPLPEPQINYNHDSGVWTHEDGRTFTTLRDALDAARGDYVTTRSGRPAPSGETNDA